MRRGFGLFFALILIALLAYLSRFWVFGWWGRDGLLGVEALRPGGDLWRGWMGDLGLGAFDIVLWAAAAFAVLTLAEKLWSRIFSDH